MSFSVVRPRRLRRSEAIRSLSRETRFRRRASFTRFCLSRSWFVCPGARRAKSNQLDAVSRSSRGTNSRGIAEVEATCIPGIVLFGIR